MSISTLYIQMDPAVSSISTSSTKNKSIVKTAVTISKLFEGQPAVHELLEKNSTTASGMSVKVLLKYIVENGCTWVSCTICLLVT